MISYAEIKPKILIVYAGEPYEILDTSGIVKKQRQKPHNTAKMRNMRTGSTTEKTFTQADKIEEAEIETKKMKYLYTNRGESWFSNPTNPKNRISISETLIENQLPYLLENTIIEAIVFNGEILKIKLPIKVDITIKEAPPNTKGNTTQGGTKVVILETGAKVTVPLFVEAGDKIRVNTETGKYSERV